MRKTLFLVILIIMIILIMSMQALIVTAVTDTSGDVDRTTRPAATPPAPTAQTPAASTPAQTTPTPATIPDYPIGTLVYPTEGGHIEIVDITSEGEYIIQKYDNQNKPKSTSDFIKKDKFVEEQRNSRFQYPQDPILVEQESLDRPGTPVESTAERLLRASITVSVEEAEKKDKDDKQKKEITPDGIPPPPPPLAYDELMLSLKESRYQGESNVVVFYAGNTRYSYMLSKDTENNDVMKVFENGKPVKYSDGGEKTISLGEFKLLYEAASKDEKTKSTFKIIPVVPFLKRVKNYIDNADIKTVLGDVFGFVYGSMQYQGWGAVNFLFHSKEEAQERREKVADKFCKVTLAGTQQCFQETMCNKYSDKVKGNNGVLYTVSSGNLRQAAYITAQKAQVVSAGDINSTWKEYYYIVEYAIASPEKEVFYKILFKGDQELEYPANEWLNVPSGGSVNMRGSNALVPPATRGNYDQACIKFQTSFKGQDILCNKVVEKEQSEIAEVVAQQQQGYAWSGNIMTIVNGSIVTLQAPQGGTI